MWLLLLWRGMSIREPLQNLLACEETNWNHSGKKPLTGVFPRQEPQLPIQLSSLHVCSVSIHGLQPLLQACLETHNPCQKLTGDTLRKPELWPSLIPHLTQTITICVLNPPPGYTSTAVRVVSVNIRLSVNPPWRSKRLSWSIPVLRWERRADGLRE